MIGEDELDDTYLVTGYIDAVWPSFALALSEYVNDGTTTSSPGPGPCT